MDWYTLDDAHNVVKCEEGQYPELPYDKRIVKQEFVGGYWLSTVFISLDHRYGDDGPPILFESMAFSVWNYEDKQVQRYCTWAEAEAGHKDMAQWCIDNRRWYWWVPSPVFAFLRNYTVRINRWYWRMRLRRILERQKKEEL